MPKEIPFFIQPIETKSFDNMSEILDRENSSVEKLERTFKKYIGSKYAIAVTNSSSAIHLALCALNLKRGDKILCSVNSFVGIPEGVRHFDSEPIFVDCIEDSYTIDLDKLEIAIELNQSKKLKAVIVNHLAGNNIDLDRLYAIAKEHKIKVIEDATDAMGKEYNGNKIGNTGADITIFNFAPHMSNPLVNGAMFVTNGELLYERAKILKNHCILDEDWNTYGKIEYLYNVIDVGWEYNMSETEAYMALSIFENIDKNIARVQEIASIYNKKLSNIKGLKVPEFENKDFWSQYIIEIDKNRDHFAKKLKNRGISIALHYVPLHLLDYYKKKYSIKVFDFPVSLNIYQKVMSLPIYPSMSNEDVDIVCEVINEVASEHI